MPNDFITSNLQQITNTKFCEDSDITATESYLLDVDIFDDRKIYSETYSHMPAFRQKAIDNFKFTKDKKLSLGAWALLQYAMKMHDCNDFEQHLKWGDNGKPFCCSNEFKSKNFNLSHSGHYALCSISDKQIGCDIQKHEDFENGLINHCMNQNELHAFKDRNYSTWNTDAFYRLWTLKESLMKMLSVGMSLDPKQIEFTYIDAISGTYKYKIQDEFIKSKFNNNATFLELDSPPNYSISICVSR